MLVLNTGQVPWDLPRQLETVYSQFLKTIKGQLIDAEVEIFSKDDQSRRSGAGQYQSSTIIELLLLFSSRKTEVELKDRVAEDFARLDAIETTAHAEFIQYFIEMLRSLAKLDIQFSRLPKDPDSTSTRLNSGKKIFGSFPAIAGFATAVAVALFDEPGFTIDWTAVPSRLIAVQKAVDALLAKMTQLDEAELREFLQLSLLEERLSGRRGGVGRYERELFKRAFSAMLKLADRLDNMAPCWLAT